MSAPSFTVASSSGVNLVVHDLGGSGEPLLICHATGFHGRCYAPLARSLAERFHVLAPDLRAHGASNAPEDGNMDWSGFVDDVLAVADAVLAGSGLASLRAVGHSMGGGAILGAAARRSGVIRQAVVFEPIVIPTPTPEPGGFRMGDAARRRKDDFATRAEALMRYAQRGALSVLRADALAAYVNHGFVDTEGGVRLACSPESEARTFEATGKPHYELLADVTMPVTVIRGGDGGQPGPSMFAPQIADFLSGGRLLDGPRLDHFGPLQDPDGVAAMMLDEFDRFDAAG